MVHTYVVGSLIVESLQYYDYSWSIDSLHSRYVEEAAAVSMIATLLNLTIGARKLVRLSLYSLRAERAIITMCRTNSVAVD